MNTNRQGEETFTIRYAAFGAHLHTYTLRMYKVIVYCISNKFSTLNSQQDLY